MGRSIVKVVSSAFETKSRSIVGGISRYTLFVWWVERRRLRWSFHHPRGRSAPRKSGGVFWRRRTRAKSFEMEEETEESQTLSIATKLVHPKTSVEDPYAASAPPLYQTATFAQPNATENGRYDYTRSGNPSRDQLEEQFARPRRGDESVRA